MYKVAQAYDRGEGVPMNRASSVEWYRLAAGKGHGLAQYELGRAYWLGSGVDRDEGQAVGWYQRAADGGIDEAQFQLGLALLEGRGTARDPVQGCAWISLAVGAGEDWQALAGPDGAWMAPSLDGTQINAREYLEGLRRGLDASELRACAARVAENRQGTGIGE